jgi:hypothetical protein
MPVVDSMTAPFEVAWILMQVSLKWLRTPVRDLRAAGYVNGKRKLTRFRQLNVDHLRV